MGNRDFNLRSFSVASPTSEGDLCLVDVRCAAGEGELDKLVFDTKKQSIVIFFIKNIIIICFLSFPRKKTL